MLRRPLAVAVRCLAAAVALLPAAARAQVHFDNLSGGNGAAYAGHSENGFDVATTGGAWFEAHVFGNPVPSIFGGPIGSPSLSSLFVTRTGGGAFTFGSVDLVSQNGRSSYQIIGYSGINSVFTMNGFLGSSTTFETIFSTNPATLIDGLSIAIDPIGQPTSFNLDNIEVIAATSSVPEPATLLLTAAGMLAVAGAARRRRAI